jgi:hypothetical protein
MEPSVRLLKQAAVRIALQLSDRKEIPAHSRKWTVLKPAWTRFPHRLLSSEQSTSQILEAGYVAERAIVAKEIA